MRTQYVDASVSIAKFDQEIADFRKLADQYGRRGWFLADARYPVALVILATPEVRPPAIVTGVLFDFANYDAEPPSVRLVNPFTREPYLSKDLPTVLNRALPAQTFQVPGMPDGGLQVQGAQSLMQASTPDETPFLCIPGVREYHEHPGHSGDVWDLHRASGAGRLVRLLEVIAKYGVDPIRGYGVNLIPQIGFEFGEPPP